ncbi:MAG: hypothetical protein AAGF11_31150 [Myxococcota bacterium]
MRRTKPGAWVLVVMLGVAGCGGDQDPTASEDGTGDEVSGAAGPAGGEDSAGERPPVVGYCEGDPAGSPGPDPSLGFQPEVEPTGWGPTDAGGVANPGGRCPDGKGGTPMRLPRSDVEYCVKASAACETGEACCPLFVTINAEGPYFGRVDEPQVHGDFITVELYTESDGDEIKHKLAELPRVIAHDYPGLDRGRVYGIGWSAGSGAVRRGLCHRSKQSDLSELGTTSDIYAALVGIGGCGCAFDYVQLAGNWHVLTWNGMDDQFAADSCAEGLTERAAINGCERLDASWQPVAPDDPYAHNADGSTNAERLDFGRCAFGEVTGYRFRDEGHVLSAKKHFEPKIRAYDTAWEFLQGKVKDPGPSRD